MRRVVVTGLGAVTPLGVGAQRSWRRLMDAQSGIVGLNERNYPFDLSQQRSRLAALVPHAELESHKNRAISQSKYQQTSKFTRLALLAAKEALEDAKWEPRTPSETETTGVCLGSGIGSLETIFDASIEFQSRGAKKISPYFIPKLLTNLAAGQVSIQFGLKGPCHTATTACATGAHSIGDASRLIAFGDANVMLAGGAESCIHPLAFIGFERLRSLSTAWNDTPLAASRPFDKGRDGFVIGEGAAVVILEELKHALGRGAHIYAELKGYGLSSDAHHYTSPPKNGEGALRAMQRALLHAGIAPKNVDYINAHATSTLVGDAAELYAIEHLMRDAWQDRPGHTLSVNSNKGAIGHLLGAAGAIEAIFSILAMRDSVIPPTLNLDCLERPAASQLDFVKAESVQRHLQVCISNSFGFGGTNASLCFTEYST